MSVVLTQGTPCEEVFARILETTNEGVWILDAAENTQFVNPAMCEMLGYSREEILGRHPFTFMPPEQRPIARDRLSRHKAGIREQHEMRFTKKDGSDLWALISATPMSGPDGRITGVIGMFSDITARRRAEQIRAGQNHALQLLATGHPLDQVLSTLILTFEEQIHPVRCCILLLDGNTQRLFMAAAPSFPPAYRESFREGMPIGPRNGSCGTAAFLKQRVIVEDVGSDPLWEEMRSVPLQHGFRSSWSQPIFGSNGMILGTFGICSAMAHTPSEEQLRFMETAAHVAGLAIERHQAEEARNQLQRSTAEALALLDTLQAHAPVGFAFLDREFRFVRINQTLAEMNHLSISEHIGRSVAEVVPVLWPIVEPQLRRALAGKTLSDVELSSRFPTENDPTHHWLVSFYPVRIGEEIVGVGAVVNDITLRKRADARRHAKQAAAHRRAVRAMEEVLGIVGHELRTPLAGMRAISEFLLTDMPASPGQTDEFLRQLNSETVRMSETVNDLLEAARLNSGRARWNWGPVYLQAVCRDALETVRPLLDPSAVRLTLEVDPPEASMTGDADAIRRLVINLLSNARKHTTSGAISVTARVQEVEGTPGVSIEVRDTGAGISPHLLERLGEAFAINSGVVGTNHVEGAGLGLAICKGIAAAHGGWLHIDSTRGTGTRIVATLRSDLEEPATRNARVNLARESAPVDAALSGGL